MTHEFSSIFIRNTVKQGRSQSLQSYLISKTVRFFWPPCIVTWRYSLWPSSSTFVHQSFSSLNGFHIIHNITSFRLPRRITFILSNNKITPWWTKRGGGLSQCSIKLFDYLITRCTRRQSAPSASDPLTFGWLDQNDPAFKFGFPDWSGSGCPPYDTIR